MPGEKKSGHVDVKKVIKVPGNCVLFGGEKPNTALCCCRRVCAHPGVRGG